MFDERKIAFDGLSAIATAICSGKSQDSLIFIVGPMTEQIVGPVEQTPQFFSIVVGEILVMVKITDSQNVLLSLAPKTRKGQPAEVEGFPEWSTNDESRLALEPSEDGKSCLVKAVGPLGVADVSVVADADLGEGVKKLVGTAQIEIIAGEAVQLDLEAGVPEEQE